MGTGSFDSEGYALVPGVLSEGECEAIGAGIRSTSISGGGRWLLSEAWCVALAKRLRQQPEIAKLLPEDHVAVQCTFFEKSGARNWLVPVHQDLSIPVAERVSADHLRGWSEKDGQLFVQAPLDVLERLVAIRIHLDDCGLEDGPLKVIPGSHQRGVLSPELASKARRSEGEVVCVAKRGGALVMRPLLLHASSKSNGRGLRRVLHFLFGPRDLPSGLQWQRAA